MVLCSSKAKRKYTNYWKVVIRMSYHVRPIVIGVSDPAASICWERQLKGCDPFIAINVSLCINSTHCKHISKVNLKPVIITVFCPRAPAVSSVTFQPAELWLVSAYFFFICGAGCHLTVRNYFWVWNSDRARQTSGVIFWMESKKHSKSCPRYASTWEVLRYVWFILITFTSKKRKFPWPRRPRKGEKGTLESFIRGGSAPKSNL